MRYLAIFLLIPFLSYGQIDLSEINLDTDSTVQIKPDTAYWKFEAATATFTRPNGTKKDVQVYEAKLIVWQGGKRTTPISSGVLTKKDYIAFLDQYRDQHNSEIDIITNALSGIRDRRDALVSEIKSVRSR